MFRSVPPGASDTASRDSQPDAPLRIAAVRHGLRSVSLGNPLIYLPEVDSTNTYASALVRAGAGEGVIVTTDLQTAGRGRAGRVWKPLPNQQLILSIVLRPPFPPHYLVMASALAVAETVEAVTGLAGVEIKWPNDVLVSGRKVCGILIETSDGVAILGMGLNVNGALAGDADLASSATTLAAASGQPVAREELAIALITRLDGLYLELCEGGAAAQRALRDRWRARLVTLGRHVTVRQTPALARSGAPDEGLAGVAEDVDTDGALLLRLDDGQVRAVTWGDVE